jgi:hypothetical protein
MVWKQISQDMVRNVMIELLELEEEDGNTKKFIGLVNWEREKNIIFPFEDGELVAKAILRIVEE